MFGVFSFSQTFRICFIFIYFLYGIDVTESNPSYVNHPPPHTHTQLFSCRRYCYRCTSKSFCISASLPSSTILELFVRTEHDVVWMCQRPVDSEGLPENPFINSYGFLSNKKKHRSGKRLHTETSLLELSPWSCLLMNPNLSDGITLITYAFTAFQSRNCSPW